MSHVTVRNLYKSFGTFEAVKDISFEINKGKLIGLLGPSGGGKTTVLRMLAGLEEPDSGDILFHQTRINTVPPQQRGIGFVFQNYALFRHMNVFDNIAFGLTVKKLGKAKIQERVNELLALTGLEGLAKRLPVELSGGQRQRVAFARALAPEPQLLLLDEPFAAIDAKVRKELRTWLREMIDRVGITSIFVTHDQEEAIEVADEIMIINQGQLEQKGTPFAIYQTPKTAFVASFVGESNQLNDLSGLKGFTQAKAGAHAVIRPEFIELGNEQEISILSAAEKAIVRHVYFRGVNWQVEVVAGTHTLFAYRSKEQVLLEPGDEIYALIHRVYVFSDGQTETLENEFKFDRMPVHI